MSAEGTPPTDRTLLARPLGWLTQGIVRFPLPVLLAALAAGLISVVLTVVLLGFHTSRLDLLNPESGYNQLWLQYIDEFGEADDAVVVVEGASREQVTPVLAEVAAGLALDDHLFRDILYQVDLSAVRAKGLHYCSAEELGEVDHFLAHGRPVLQRDWSSLNLEQMTAALNARLRDPSAASNAELSRAAAARELAGLSASLLTSLADPKRYQSPWESAGKRLASLESIQSQYLLTNQGRIGFVLLRLADTGDGFAAGSAAIDRLRELIGEIQQRHPGMKIGLTGLPVMENDEMRASQGDMIVASLVSLLGVACLFVAGFGGIRYPLMTIATLLLAMAWAFGYVTLAMGHLNILSVSFGVILIGLGIDFGIHYVSSYLHARRSIADSGAALVETARSIGPGIVTGGVTTAIAFFTAMLTEFTGVAELGQIAGGGILLCVVAMLVVLPAMICLYDRGKNNQQMPEPLHVNRWVATLVRNPALTLMVGLTVIFSLAAGVTRLRYDHNLLNLQPIGLESVELERKLLTETDQSVWFALSIANSPEELLARKQQFLKLPMVDRTEEIASLLPASDSRRESHIAHVAERLSGLPEQVPLIPVPRPGDLDRQLQLAQSLLAGDDPANRQTVRELSLIRASLARLREDEAYARLSAYQQQMAGDLLGRLHALRSMASPEPPRLTDLPASLVTRFVGKSHCHLLKIYSRGDIWDMDALESFVTQVKQIDPAATGQPLQTYYASRQMQQSYINAALYSLVAVSLVLMLDFWSLSAVGMALLPVGLGVLQMFGLLGLLDIPLNPANMIVLPLILGIGIDDGVHVVHDFRRQRGRYQLSDSTATAVLITSLTTMVGFGSLMLAGHQGLQSLGRVLTIGVTCCLFTSLVILPAMLSLVTRHRRAEGDPPVDAEAPEAEGPAIELEAGGATSPRRRADSALAGSGVPAPLKITEEAPKLELPRRR